MIDNISKYLNRIVEEKGAGYFVLIDPDTRDPKELKRFTRAINQAGADGILVGGSLLFGSNFSETVKNVQEESEIPVILFPGSSQQVSAEADAILFLSLVSGRNPEYLIGNHVLAAPQIKQTDLEVLATGYLLFKCGQTTTAEYMSNTKPLPIHKPKIAAAHALAAQYMGMQYVYLEGGSGADHPIPTEIIQAVSSYIDIPVITGGGIRKPEQAAQRVEAGAKFIVTGNLYDDGSNIKLMEEFVNAIHYRE